MQCCHGSNLFKYLRKLDWSYRSSLVVIFFIYNMFYLKSRFTRLSFKMAFKKKQYYDLSEYNMSLFLYVGLYIIFFSLTIKQFLMFVLNLRNFKYLDSKVRANISFTRTVNNFHSNSFLLFQSKNTCIIFF